MRQSLRRKSCNACARSKRRCSLSLPSCRRCAAKGVECSYPTVTPVPPPLSLLLGDSFDNVLLPLQMPSATEAYGMQLDSAEHHPHTANDYTARAEFLAHLMSLQSTALADKGSNVFVHSSQTLASDALRDALAGSALHAVRNTSNVRFVDSEITRRASNIVAVLDAASLSHDTADLRMLPSVQALLVYQCIRLFSPGSISQQTQAERDNFVLQIWASRLQLSLSSCDDDLIGASWEIWVEQEAIRRTLLCIELAQGTYTYLRGNWPIGLRCNHDLRFNAQKALWEAKSAAEWRLVCDDFAHPSLPCNMIRLHKDIRDAMPGDLDDLGVLLRAAGQGLADMNTWLRHDKEALQRWGQVGV
ncbi:fungal zn(2)-Cys(6) binuclear cluster domain protein [Fusarium subglutinans]|uniref:Fungal zn(2)-Cys(6) binuclear cluster domain protein n=1 Tax=Gibberella subglutinans TaxID=42677 RepID=A0A8H5UPY3_GIBSU|nr:fungal zn(2)-Cys(6) binuclear cluster domain protein [Fusarium subglutinans]KAF5595186.1 fungal zn(2)-Cys(6) binuclear cluster domain protein [Fusarium subglutinans]